MHSKTTKEEFFHSKITRVTWRSHLNTHLVAAATVNQSVTNKYEIVVPLNRNENLSANYKRLCNLHKSEDN